MIEISEAAADALEALQHAHAAECAAEIARIVAIATLADEYQVSEDDVWNGVADLEHIGADGTPSVGEYLGLEIGPILGMDPGAALWQVKEIIDVRHRHPSLWEAFLEGRIRFFQAARVASECRSLSFEQVSQIDRRIAHAMVTMPWGRVMRELGRWIMSLDVDEARRRAHDRRRDRRVWVDEVRDGHVEFHGLVSAADGIAFEHAINEIASGLPRPEVPAHIEGDEQLASRMRRDLRRAAAVGELVRLASGQGALPVHELIVHIPVDDPAITGGEGSGVAEIEGRWGRLLTEQLPEFLSGSKVIVRPVLDPTALMAVEAYRPPDLMKHAVRVRNPVDVFPFGTRQARNCDLDHTIPYAAAGQTAMDNLGPLSRRAHRGKTHGGWRLSQPQPGVYLWRSPAGYEYLVTAHGTQRVGVPDRSTERSDAPPTSSSHPPPDHPAWDALPRYALAEFRAVA